ncbi:MULTISPECIES: ComEA family DNA-binding protein [Streptacidiphilus]|uniref:Helix-hairpin-helix domain-containing protein n=1 Tax=Streptacidiphilus cavernicola TaxID=3342716 RepID=A0ABV6UF26_9ACTN|nr:ComEA family DNA-binding protein [Streptacidiphilus jeojiense]
MRTLTRDRDTTTELVRQRMDALFEPGPAGRGRGGGSAARAPLAAAAPPAPGAGPSPEPAPLPVRRRLPLALQERLDLDRRAVVGLSVLLVLGVGYGAQQFWAGRPEPVAVPTAEVSAGASLSPPLSSTLPSAASSVLVPSGAGAGAGVAGGVVVDVAGRVREPGVRTLPAGSRVQDALKAAGGAAPGTDLTGLNLARRLNDGEEIIVGAAPGAAGASGSSARPAGPLSLNSATVEQLDALPGLGPVLAQRIIQYRDQHGGFTSVDQLRKVSGFGERRLADLRAKLQP